MKKILFIVISGILFFQISAFAQRKVTLSGYVKDARNGENLIGASIYLSDANMGTSSNIYGFYSLTVPEGNHKVQISYVGYKTSEYEIDLRSAKILNIELQDAPNELQEVVVSLKSADMNIKSTRIGAVDLDVKQTRVVPVVFGEQDLLKTLQLKPGVKAAGEGSSGFYVRGGSSDQNLILLDEAPVYNASHLLGFFSVFNSDAIKNVELLKGSMPAIYGGRISSVLDLKMNEGNSKNYTLSGGIGLISSRLTVEGPIIKDSASFIISGRRTYADLFTKSLGDEQMKKIGLYFYDLNAKTNFIINQNNRLFLSGYFGRDVFNFNNRFGFEWGNATATLRWNHLISNKLFMNTSFIFSDYRYVIGMEMGSSRLDIKSGIMDFNLKEDMQYFLNPNNSLKFGFNTIHHTFYPGEMSFGDTLSTNRLVIEKRFAIENGVYLLNEMKAADKLKINYGLRISSFSLLGPGNYYVFDANGQVTDTSKYNQGDRVKTYLDWEPRISLNYMLNPTSSIKTSFTRSYQYLHLLSKTTSSSPSDLWIPSSNIVKPQHADQYSLGFFKNLNNNIYCFSSEVYYKNMYDLVDYKNGADLSLNELVESQLVFGKGRAYGIEFSVEKKEGKLTGWISYTLSRTERKFEAINNGSWFPAKQDRTHDFNIVGMFKLNDRLTLSASWIFYTGDAVTFPSGKYKIENYTVNYFSERNGERMPDYHRLDLGMTYTAKKTARYESSWSFSIYNAYARQNAYSISFREVENNPMMTEAVRLSLFSIVPSVTYNFKF
jgi:hypothetical protein